MSGSIPVPEHSKFKTQHSKLFFTRNPLLLFVVAVIVALLAALPERHDDPDLDRWVRERIPAGRWGDPRELVGAADPEALVPALRSRLG